MASIGGQIAGDMEGSVKGGRIVPMHAAEMPTATGLKKAKPERLTTIRQVNHYEDNLARINQDRDKKAALRADLERQMQAKVFKRERERLYIDERQLATSKSLLTGVGAQFPDNRPAEETTDMRILQKDEDFTN